MELGRGPKSDDLRAATRRTWFRPESISLGEQLGNFADIIDAAYAPALGATQH